jgi:hypothetical protein
MHFVVMGKDDSSGQSLRLPHADNDHDDDDDEEQKEEKVVV